jgi:hypothetical protein
MLHLKVILDDASTVRTCIVILEDEIWSVPLSKWHNDRLDDVVTVVEPCDIVLAYVKVGPVIHTDACPHHYTATSITVVCNSCRRLVTLTSPSPDTYSTIMKIQNETGLIRKHH